ncbi:unnamed protein product [Peronospora belbahrii]|uniref:Transmembrane protein n=1 Tax=Peronospora belbahrii TaxID=622444 RepID=A0AAU9LNH5_9STRA|nr:unnamed protein product [Peronospora belbahrii]CAH0513430.1 unnamed protein product [Peronospora belbahrii]
MSDVVVPSFFPTSTEIAGGIQWVKQHPVVVTAAAAAATAVSVFTYLKATTEDEMELKPSSILSPRSKQNETNDRCSSTASDASTPSRDRILSPCNLSSIELDTDVDVKMNDTTMGKKEVEGDMNEGDGGTGSPQWGWYVSTTPPEDYYT